MCYDNKRRRRKQAVLSKFMKRKCVITPQEVHGSEAMLRTFVDTQPHPYKVFFSEFPSADSVNQNSTGGRRHARALAHADGARAATASSAPALRP